MTNDVEIVLQVEDRCVFRMSLTTHPQAFDLLRDYIKKYDQVRHKQVLIGNAETGFDHIRLTVPWEG